MVAYKTGVVERLDMIIIQLDMEGRKLAKVEALQYSSVPPTPEFPGVCVDLRLVTPAC